MVLFITRVVSTNKTLITTGGCIGEVINMADYYSGTSGLVLPVPNKTHYPAEFKERSRLCYYGYLFNSIEVNSSFYKIPLGKTIAKWAADVPADFRFTFKLWRGITHEKGLLFNRVDVNRFMDSINAAQSKKGCLLVQFPPSAKSSLTPQLYGLLNTLFEADPDRSWKIALEFRHNSWYTETLFEYAEENKLSLVLHDIPASATPLDYYAVSDTVYLRFHGPGGKYRGSYDDDVLYEYASYINEWREEGKTVYVYFNNTMGDAVKNLETLNRIIGGEQ